MADPMPYKGSKHIMDSRRDFMAEHLSAYLESGGAQGHLIDLSIVGARGYLPTLLLGTTGRKTGKRLISPLIYGCYAGEWVIIASKGGAPAHPAWYLNLEADPDVVIQIATEAFKTKSRIVKGAERKPVWDYMVDLFPPYANYEKAAGSREIPVVMLKLLEPTEIFKPSEARGLHAG